MKNLLLLASLTALLAGCSANHDINQTKAAPANAEGGINGGGGGTLPAEPITVYEVLKIITEAKKTLNLYVKYEMHFDGVYTEELSQKLYGGPTTLWDVLQNTNIEIENKKPCYDSKGHAVDGSIHASKPNAICISAYRIAPKLERDRARVEILGLIVHELSHLVGATEFEATHIQKQVTYVLREKTNKDSAHEFLTKLDSETVQLESMLSAAETQAATASDGELLKLVEEANSQWTELYKLTTELPFSVLSSKDESRFRRESTQMMVDLWYLMSIASENSKERAYWGGQLDKGFNKASQVSLQEFETKMYSFNEPRDPRLVLLRPKNRAELKEHLDQLSEEFSIFSQAVRNLLLRSQVGPLYSSLETNPWTKFVGEYNVVKSDCSSPMTVTAIKINQLNERSLELIKYYPNGYGQDGFLSDGGHVPSGQTAVRVEGDSNSASRIAELGDRWGDKFEQRKLTLAKQSDGSYLMTQASLWRERTLYDGWKEQSSSCTLTLQKK